LSLVALVEADLVVDRREPLDERGVLGRRRLELEIAVVGLLRALPLTRLLCRLAESEPRCGPLGRLFHRLLEGVDGVGVVVVPELALPALEARERLLRRRRAGSATRAELCRLGRRVLARHVHAVG